MFRWIGFLFYVFLILEIADISGFADVHWPWGKLWRITVPGPGATTLPGNLQDQVVYESIFSGAVLIRSFRQDFREKDKLQVALEHAQKAGDEEIIKLNEDALANTTERMRITFSLYIAQLETARNFSDAQLSNALADLEAAFGKQEGMQPFVNFARLYVSHSTASRQDGVIDRRKIFEQIVSQKP